MRKFFLSFLLLSLIVFHDNGLLIQFETFIQQGGSTVGIGDNECTIMVISGRATADGRPIVWKNRDVIESDQRYLYIPPREYNGQTTHGYIGNFYTSDSSRCFMGINEAGFAIINANCYNLSDILRDGINDGHIMKLALEWCANIEDWEELLTTTGIYGRQDSWLFGAMDASGEAKLYECDNFNHTIYNANDLEDAPEGYILRTVFGLSGWHTREGLKRFNRAQYLLDHWTDKYPLDVEFILQRMARDFSLTCNDYDDLDDPYPLPYYGSQGNLPTGFVITAETINRFKTRSCSIIRGVLPNEDPLLSTTFAMLGQPILSLAVPLWISAEYVPYCLRGGEQAPWYELISQRMQQLYPLDVENGDRYMNSLYLLDSLKTGVYSWSLDLERWGLEQAENYLSNWRENGFDVLNVRQGLIQISNVLWNGFVNEGGLRLEVDDNRELLPASIQSHNYPNPFNIKTVISFELPPENGNKEAFVNVFTILGEKVRNLGEIFLENGRGAVVWDGKNESGNSVSSGIYLYRIDAPGIKKTGKMILLK